MSSYEQGEGPDEDPRGDTAFLAEQSGLPVDDFVETFGAGWQLMPLMLLDDNADPEHRGDIFSGWFVAGEPFQICLRLRDGGVELGMPVGRWVWHQMTWQVHRREYIPTVNGGAAGQGVVARLLKARRSAFHYCRYCRRLTPPEDRFAVDVCYGCASIWQGVVF